MEVVLEIEMIPTFSPKTFSQDAVSAHIQPGANITRWYSLADQ